MSLGETIFTKDSTLGKSSPDSLWRSNAAKNRRRLTIHENLSEQNLAEKHDRQETVYLPDREKPQRQQRVFQMSSLPVPFAYQ